MLRWFQKFQVDTTCFSCSPPDLNLVVINFMFCLYVIWPLPPGDNTIVVNKYIIILLSPLCVIFKFYIKPYTDSHRVYRGVEEIHHVVSRSPVEKLSSSSSSSSRICHGVGPLVDPFQFHVSGSLFKGLPWFLLPVGEECFITLGNLFRDILFTCCIQFPLYAINLSKIGVIFNSFAICAFLL